MPLKVEKKPRENSQTLIQRFSQKVKRSGLLLEARKKMFLRKPQSKKMKKRAAIRREKKKQEFQRKKKLGEI